MKNLNKKLLFICTYNEMRSPTAEEVFRKEGWKTASAGTAATARKVIEERLLSESDIIFVMEKKHRDFIKKNFITASANKKIINLEIHDNYHYMEKELVSMLREKVLLHLYDK